MPLAPARPTPAGPGGRDGDDDAEVEALLQRVSESRHAGERREALGQLRDLLPDNPQVGAHKAAAGGGDGALALVAGPDACDFAHCMPAPTDSTFSTSYLGNVWRAQVQLAMGTMGLPVLLSVLQEDRDDTELLRTALEALALSFVGAGRQAGTPRGAARDEVRRSVTWLESSGCSLAWGGSAAIVKASAVAHAEPHAFCCAPPPLLTFRDPRPRAS